MSKHSIVRWIKIIGVYLLVAAVAALGWLWCALPEQIYLEPDNNWGRAPFYSHEKKFAGYTFSTFTFNLLMLGIFALLVIISIFAEFPGKYLNKGSD